MPQRTALITTTAFVAFGKNYAVGDEVQANDAEKWPAGTLERRVENKFITPTLVEDTTADTAASLTEAADKISNKSTKDK